MAQTVVEHVVADSGAFLKKVHLQELGRNIYTLKAVVDEIRDRQTRRGLAFLPYELHFKEPLPEHVRHVTEFSKKTGDYPSLSATDIKVLALTYQLELEHVGSEHLKTEPELQMNIQSTQRHPEAPVNMAGFHLPVKGPGGDGQRQTDRQKLSSPTKGADQTDGGRFNSFQFWREPLPSIDDELLALLDEGGASRSAPPPPTGEGAGPRPSEDQSDDEDKENEPEEEDEDDGGGWITPSNIQQVKLDSADWTAPDDVTVGCLTTDFAMQNVLIQMGLRVLSVNGMVIKQARSYILRCHACFRTTSNMTRAFCPHCGNKTLKKVSVTLNDNGSLHMHFSKNPKVLNPRGLRHSLPLPQGGKHGNNPQLVEDQRFPQQRLSSKARQKTDVFDPDYVAGSSPFCQNDIYSRAANLQIRDGQCGGGRRRANPNTARRKFVKKK
ncbi:RNA-binding protein NOB1 isoform X2 [Cololabis saira]|uniref:RNA-binding protein NOB1 isoform X2 n=1 Tax=Cololabis saira TaxID=129043 RepID=UPI002AD3B132|nr:RNA-binding protein NOB1 isoform X2 [Cololabis saira]